MPRDVDHLNLLTDLIARAQKAGATAADAIMSEGISVGVTQRFGKAEKVSRAEGRDLGLRVLVGQSQAIVSSTDFSRAALDELVDRAVAMAKLAPEDPYLNLAPAELLATNFPDLDTIDPIEPDAETLVARAHAAEDAALAVKGVTNSEGGDAGWGRSSMALATSNGFAATSSGTYHSVSVSVLAGEGTGMERDYDWSSAVHASDLEDPAVLGKRAGDKAVKRLNPRKVATIKVPIVFDPRVSGGFLRNLAGAISGPSIARGTSFLKDKLGKQVFAKGLTVIDDPFRPRGFRSHGFDGEGLAPQRRAIIEDGVLTTWFLDLRSAKQLGLTSTGHAGRGTSSPPSPSPSNLYLEPGDKTPAELIAEVGTGLYVTEMLGQGVNGVTGDYSRGAAGYWIENGELAYPVSEITIAGNLKEMFLHLTPANDLEFRSGIDAPTVRVDGMTIAGA